MPADRLALMAAATALHTVLVSPSALMPSLSAIAPQLVLTSASMPTTASLRVTVASRKLFTFRLASPHAFGSTLPPPPGPPGMPGPPPPQLVSASTARSPTRLADTRRIKFLLVVFAAGRVTRRDREQPLTEKTPARRISWISHPGPHWNGGRHEVRVGCNARAAVRLRLSRPADSSRTDLHHGLHRGPRDRRRQRRAARRRHGGRHLARAAGIAGRGHR